MPDIVINIITVIIQIAEPIIAFAILYNSIVSLRDKRRPKRPLVTLVNMVNADSIPILYWENSIGRSKTSDIVLTDPTVSRNHAVLYRRASGWLLKDTVSHGGTRVNDEAITKTKLLELGDVITFGCTSFVFSEAQTDEIESQSWFFGSRFSKRVISTPACLILLTLFQLLAFIELSLSSGVASGTGFSFEYMLPFFLLTAINWGFFATSRLVMKIKTFELETIALFLSGIGVAIISRTELKSVYTQIIAMSLGIVLYSLMIKFLENPDTVMKWRLKIAIIAVAVLAINLVLGTTVNGSKNWIVLGPISVQPSEFVKIALIIMGTSTLVQLQTAKNLGGFIAFSAICIGALFLMGDFGTACIFFFTFLIIAFMRSGDLRTIVLIIVAACFGVFLILRFKPYIAERFASWGHAFEYVQTTGYQQAHVLSYTASGGLFGYGLGRGNLYNIFAADSDLAFGLVCEEMGIIIAILIALAIVSLAFYSRALSEKSRSTLYSIAACAVGGMFVFQAALNIFGATDILPLTGVTLPFISAGGSSIMSVWGLLSFIKAADERTYAL